MPENKVAVQAGPCAVVRPALESDLGALAVLHDAAFQSAWPLSFWRGHLKERSSILLVADDDSSRCAAGLLARRVLDEAEIIAVFTAAASRRLGLAGLLLAELERDLRRELPCRIFLEVAVDNAAALRLYRRRGYVEAGRRIGYYSSAGPSAGPAAASGAAIDALILSLDLRPPTD